MVSHSGIYCDFLSAVCNPERYFVKTSLVRAGQRDPYVVELDLSLL